MNVAVDFEARFVVGRHHQASALTNARIPCDSGIMKWPTSAVCFGPPLGQNELLVWTERLIGLEAGVGLESQGGAL
jgi:hypothetical protein